jgi:hypothetical protein
MHHSARRLNALAKGLGARRYLEIGVASGTTFRDVAIAERTGVDPHFAFDTKELANDLTRFVAAPSDAFFAREPLLPPYDVIFIDGLHRFEQVVRDLGNALLRSHRRSVILLDDTLPNDVYSPLASPGAAHRFRRQAGSDDASWHGDVFKIAFYLHDFWPGLSYRTITGSGNGQTLVWKAARAEAAPVFDSLERLARLTYFDLQDHLEVLNTCSEDEAITTCINEISAA